MATIPPPLLALFEPICKRLRAGPPQIDVPTEPDEYGGFVVTASISLVAKTFTAQGDRNGWYAISARQALLRLLKMVDPAATFHPDLLEAPQVIHGATMKLVHACLSRGLGAPAMKNVTSQSVALTERCEVTIQGLPGQSFFGQGMGYAEAKAVAATHALPIVEQLPVSEAGRREIRGPIAELMGFVFTTREPKGWLSDWCRFHRLAEPVYTTTASGKAHNSEFFSTVIVAHEGRELRESSAIHSSKGSAERDASLRALRRIAPTVEFPPDIEPTPPLAFTHLLEVMRNGKVGEPQVSCAVDLSMIPHHTCTLKIGVMKLACSARGYSEQEAKALAAAEMLRELENQKSVLASHQKKAADQAKASAELRAKAEEERRLKENADKRAAQVAANQARAARPQTVPSNTGTPSADGVRQATAKLHASMKWLGGKTRISASPSTPGEWTLRLDSGLGVTLAVTAQQTLKLLRIRDRKDIELAIPERIKGRLISLESNEADLASSIREHFIKPVEEVHAKTKPVMAPSPAAETEPQVIARVVVQPQLTSGRKEIEADPLVKGANGFFREGFLAACDGEGPECPWGVESFRRIDWQQGYDYAGLCCSQCGAQNKMGARCAMPAPIPDAPVEASLTDKLAAMLDRWEVSREDADRQEDQDLIREAMSRLVELEPKTLQPVHRFEPALCLACARKQEPARGVLCLNPGFALSHLNSLDAEAATAPYKSVALYGLRRRPKADFWAYAVITNGTLSQCVDQDIAPYRGTEELIERAVLTEATLNPSRRLKL